ncbi:MAG: 4-hydroxy-tetrahydrodipicolinate reductase [Chitinophagaceae bacterium]|jgi:4-hydroxy-tetrahydrodipicolinate reductase|nr:4-hydroxy-tetrahydrodipicolinate reductase [Chitinophagaceae bacterium]
MKLALIGYGKMGKAIHEVAKQRGHEAVLIIDADNLHELTHENIKQADVAIEFTSPHTALANVLFCLQHSVPVVCGSTGWLEKLDEAKQMAQQHHTGLIVASNFSVGVNIFFEVNKRLAQLMQGHDNYDVTLREIHHTAKKDAPSGTAISLAEQVLEQLGRKEKWVNDVAAHPGDLAIISERIDPAPGTHHVKYSSAIDDIEIIHTAHNRTGFALGAVLAAEFLKNKTGFFGMKEVLNL